MWGIPYPVRGVISSNLTVLQALPAKLGGGDAELRSAGQVRAPVPTWVVVCEDTGASKIPTHSQKPRMSGAPSVFSTLRFLAPCVFFAPYFFGTICFQDYVYGPVNRGRPPDRSRTI